MVAITCIITQLNYLNMVSILICSSVTLVLSEWLGIFLFKCYKLVSW
jgi:hypothetical protein